MGGGESWGRVKGEGESCGRVVVGVGRELGEGEGRGGKLWEGGRGRKGGNGEGWGGAPAARRWQFLYEFHVVLRQRVRRRDDEVGDPVLQTARHAGVYRV